MKKSKSIILLFCGIVFGLAAFPVFAQEAKEEVKDVRLNKKPIQDFVQYLKDKIKKGEVDLDKSFKVVLEGVLTKDGRFDVSIDEETGKPKTQFILSEGDEQMIDVAKKAIQAIGDNGIFAYLRNFGAEKIKLTLAQDGETFSANIESELKDENRAKTMASGFDVLFLMARNNAKMSDDEKILFGGIQKPTTDGKNLILNFALPKKTFHEIILRELNKTTDNKAVGE